MLYIYSFKKGQIGLFIPCLILKPYRVYERQNISKRIILCY